MVNYNTTLSPGGLTGATAPTRYVGGTASGAPVTGTFAVGDFVIDQTGKVWVCTTAGSPGTWTQVGFPNPMTTAGDLIIENATPAPARLPAGTNSLSLLGMASGLPAWTTGLCLQAATPTAGYTLVNGTGDFLTWTSANDGNLHRMVLLTMLNVTSPETGGQITVRLPLPSGAVTHTLFAANQGSGDIYPGTFYGIPIAANGLVKLTQGSALTGGAATMWAEIWGS